MRWQDGVFARDQHGEPSGDLNRKAVHSPLDLKMVVGVEVEGGGRNVIQTIFTNFASVPQCRVVHIRLGNCCLYLLGIRDHCQTLISLDQKESQRRNRTK